MDFSSDFLAETVNFTDASGQANLGTMATISLIPSADPTKTVLRIDSLLDGSTTYLVYNEGGEKEFMIRITDGENLGNYGITEAQLADPTALAAFHVAFLANSGSWMTDDPTQPGVLAVEFMDFTKHDGGYQTIVAESWKQGLVPSHVRTAANGSVINTGVTHMYSSNLLAPSGRVLVAISNQWETGPGVSLQTQNSQMASYNSDGDLMARSTLTRRGGLADINSNGTDVGCPTR